jgi:DNA-binding transcriptional LysR family regulator
VHWRFEGFNPVHEHLNGVAVFVEVVEAGSFASAAHRLAVTRSAVAKTVARLEQRLKVRLLIARLANRV